MNSNLNNQAGTESELVSGVSENINNMKIKTYEFKVKELGKEWSDIKIHSKQVYGSDERADMRALALSIEKKAEVRWNVQGSLQGHYKNAEAEGY